MLLKIPALLILAYCNIAHCFCQGDNDTQVSRLKVETFSISQYDTLYPPINFEFMNHSEGLPEGRIRSVVQTDDGYVWLSIGNHGLVRYDGYQFRSFGPMSADSSSVVTSNISQIVKSSKHGLWLVTQNSIVWFDLTTYKSKVITVLPSNQTWNCVEDGLGQLWLYSKGLFLYNPITQSFEKISYGLDGITNRPVTISTYSFQSAFGLATISYDGSIWLGGQAMCHIDPATRKVYCYSWEKKPYFHLLADPDGSHLWLSGTTGIGRYNFRENTWMDISFKKIEGENIINHVSLVENGKLWIVAGNTIKVMDTKNFRTQLFKNDRWGFKTFPTLIKGVNATRWIYNEKELLCNFLETKRFIYQKLLPKDERVLSYWKDEENNTEWFGTESISGKGSLWKHEVSSHRLSVFVLPYQPCRPSVLAKLNNREILVIGGGTSNHTGLFRFDKTELSFKKISLRIENSPALTTDSLEYESACVDHQNNIWLSIYEDGLLKYEPANNNCYLVIQPSSQKIPPGRVIVHYRPVSNRRFFAAKNGFIWWPGKDGVLRKIDVRTRNIEKVDLPIKPQFLSPLGEDLQGNIYIGTDKGMALYHPASKNLLINPGMPGTWNPIIDTNNSLIGVTNDGLWMYNAVAKTSRKFNSKDGFKQEYVDYGFNTLSRSGKNEILISDLYRVPISSLYPKKEVAPLHLTSIKVFDQASAQSENVDALDTLLLKYNENELNFEFAALSFLSHDANVYACMLVGLDTSWKQRGGNNTATYANLSPGEYSFKVKTANRDGVWGKVKTLPIIIVPAFWQTTWFRILTLAISIAIIGGIFYWFYRNRLYQFTLKNQLEIEKLRQEQKDVEFQKKLADLTLSALRSQINPHFIFNCLNSIKLYASQNDADAASTYLTKFSKLIRRVLENSRNEMITLASELEVLKLYIEMEAMRFKEKLKYTISVEQNVDADFIEIPPLLLQPYVENAIWHGLMNKAAGGSLAITAIMTDPSTLIITIQDDGVGRIKAAELKSKTAIQHASFGMKLTSERLALISQQYKTATTVRIDDLMDYQGMAAGTLITIQIKI